MGICQSMIKLCMFPFIDHGIITSIEVSLSSSSFMDDLPTFTLIGETRGGPPTIYNWTRDDIDITNSGKSTISISLKDVEEKYIESVYVSTLVVSGNLPGVYQYTVGNRAMSFKANHRITIEGTFCNLQQ